MNNLRRTLVVVLMAGALAGEAAVREHMDDAGSDHLLLDAELGFWHAAVKGDVDADTRAVAGTRLDYDSDLGLDEEGVPQLGLFAWRGDHGIRFSALGASFSGDETLTKTEVFNGQTFTAGTLVDTDLDLARYGLSYLRHIPTEYDDMDLDLLLGLESVDGEISVESASQRPSGVTVDPLFVTSGLLGDFPLWEGAAGGVWGIRTGFELGVLDVTGSDSAFSVDLAAGPFVRLAEAWSVGLDYRYYRLRFRDGREDTDIVLSGPMLALSARF
jgi:hypothetical protein